MSWLTLILHLFIGSTLAGTGVIAVLVAGYGTLIPILWAALAGFVIAIPVSIMISRALKG